MWGKPFWKYAIVVKILNKEYILRKIVVLYDIIIHVQTLNWPFLHVSPIIYLQGQSVNILKKEKKKEKKGGGGKRKIDNMM